MAETRPAEALLVEPALRADPVYLTAVQDALGRL